MSTRRILGGSAIATGLALILAGGVGAQQQPPRPPQQPPAQQQAPKPWKDAIIGSWTLLIIDGVKADGTHVPLYGPNPKGVAMYGADGRYSQQVMRDVRLNSQPTIGSRERPLSRKPQWRASTHISAATRWTSGARS
jgi:hypothetical protein